MSMITVVKPEIYPLSFTAMNRFSKCRHSFYLQKSPDYQKVISIPGNYTLIGRAGHLFAQQYLAELFDQSSSGDLQQSDYTLAATIAKSLLPQVPASCSDEFYQLCENFWESFLLEAPGFAEVHIAVELDFQTARVIDLADSYTGEYALHGVIDLLLPLFGGDLIKIWDWKFGFKMESQAEAEENLQLKIYSLATFLLYPQCQQITAALYFVKYGKARAINYYREQLPILQEEVTGYINAIETEEKFDPTPGRYCYYCEYYQSCQAYQESINNNAAVPAVITRDRAVSLEGERILLNKRISDIETALRDYTAVAGPIETPDGYRGWFAKSKADLSPIVRQIIDILLSHGIPKEALFDIISMSQSDIKGLLKKYSLGKVWKVDIEPIIPKVESTEWGMKKKGAYNDTKNNS